MTGLCVAAILAPIACCTATSCQPHHWDNSFSGVLEIDHTSLFNDISHPRYFTGSIIAQLGPCDSPSAFLDLVFMRHVNLHLSQAIITQHRQHLGGSGDVNQEEIITTMDRGAAFLRHCGLGMV